MIRYDWKPTKTCAVCGHYRHHDDHKTFECCNLERPGDPCLKPERHHPFVLAEQPPTEPRQTIVREMAEAWKGRNFVTRLNRLANLPLSSTYLGATIYERRDQLRTLRRIWRAARLEAD
jgi:hypothetical protein